MDAVQLMQLIRSGSVVSKQIIQPYFIASRCHKHVINEIRSQAPGSP